MSEKLKQDQARTGTGLENSATFFQSPVFAEFQKKIPYRGESWHIEVDGAQCVVVKMKLPLRLCWLWVPYGPVLGRSGEGREESSVEKIFSKIGEIAKKQRAIFARIEPPFYWKNEDTEKLKKLWRVKNSATRFTPECSLILDPTKTQEQLLAEMKPKGRYNINVAKKNGVVVKKYEKYADIPAHDFDAFYKILQGTAGRDSFGIHPKFFYEKLLETFGAHHMVNLFLAYHGDSVIGGVIIIFYKDTATYYYGASSYEHRNCMAPYLLQWEAIREAKKRDMKFYDFLGIAPVEEKNHPWQGVTDFKRKFGGSEVTYPPTFRVIYRKAWDFLFHLIKRI